MVISFLRIVKFYEVCFSALITSLLVLSQSVSQSVRKREDPKFDPWRMPQFIHLCEDKMLLILIWVVWWIWTFWVRLLRYDVIQLTGVPLTPHCSRFLRRICGLLCWRLGRGEERVQPGYHCCPLKLCHLETKNGSVRRFCFLNPCW